MSELEFQKQFIESPIFTDDEDIPLEQSQMTEDSKVEHCLFLWKINFNPSRIEKDPFPLESLLFSASDNRENSTLWKIDLILSCGDDINLCLSRLNSMNTSPVFVRFHWELQGTKEINKVLPGSIHTTINIGEKCSKKFAQKHWLIKNKDRYLSEGYLHVLCELSIFERKIENLISSRLKAKLPYELWELSDDMKEIFQNLTKESGADFYIRALDGLMSCHRSILSARSPKFVEILKSKHAIVNLLSFKPGVLYALLKYIYCGSIDLYSEHDIPKDLHKQAKLFGLLHLEKYLNTVCENNMTKLSKLDVTWKIPFFDILLREPQIELYCPALNSRTFFDDQWRFKIQLKSASEDVVISVIRKQKEGCLHLISLQVQVETNGKIAFERRQYLTFINEEQQNIESFLSKDKLCGMLSFQNTLVLKCSLEVLYSGDCETGNQKNTISVLDLLSSRLEESLQQLSEDLKNLFDSEAFSDTKIGNVGVHSYILVGRFLTPMKDLERFLENMDHTLIVSFLHFAYGNKIVKRRAEKLLLLAEKWGLYNIAHKFFDYLAYYPELKSVEDISVEVA